MAERLRVAIIGAGQVARTAHINHYQAIEGVEVVAVCDVSTENARQTAAQFGIARHYTDHMEMLREEKPDAVSICVPNRFHCAITCDALQAGCHVLCEKPPAITAEEAEQMRRTAEETGKLLSFGFHFRHAGRVAALKQRITAGELGEVYQAQVRWLRRRGIPGWGFFTDRQMQGGGALIDIGVHMLDLALYLMDYPAISYVCATSSDRIGKQGGIGLMGAWDGARFTVEDGLFGFVRFANGAGLELETSFALHTKERDERQVALYGDRAGATLFPFAIYSERDGQPTDQTCPFDETRDWHPDCIQNFVAACRGEASLLVTGEQATYLQRLVDAFYTSAQSGMPVIFEGAAQ